MKEIKSERNVITPSGQRHKMFGGVYMYRSEYEICVRLASTASLYIADTDDTREGEWKANLIARRFYRPGPGIISIFIVDWRNIYLLRCDCTASSSRRQNLFSANFAYARMPRAISSASCRRLVVTIQNACMCSDPMVIGAKCVPVADQERAPIEWSPWVSTQQCRVQWWWEPFNVRLLVAR